jgi:hypothetical protein
VFLLQTNGHSNGLIPMLRVYNNTARYVDQGGNKVSFYSGWRTLREFSDFRDFFSPSEKARQVFLLNAYAFRDFFIF